MNTMKLTFIGEI